MDPRRYPQPDRRGQWPPDNRYGPPGGYGSSDGYGPPGGGYAPRPGFQPSPQGPPPRDGYGPGYGGGYGSEGRPSGTPGGRPPGRPPVQPGGRPPRRPSGAPSGKGKPPAPRGRKPRIGAWVGGLSALALVAAGGIFYLRGGLNGHSTGAGSLSPAGKSSAAAGPSGPAGSPGPGSAGQTASGVPASLGTGWKQTFSATFTGSSLDKSVWDTCYPWESQSGCANFGNSDEEYQWYTPSQDTVAGGEMRILAEKAPTEGTTSGGSPESYEYRSGLVTTFPGYSFQYGYIEADAQMPSAPGLWTALWLAAKNESWPPEIDIVEHWDNDAKFFQYYHPANAPRENSSVNLGSATGWHKFGVDWTPTKVTWYVDGRPVFSTGRNVPQQPMYFLANIAVDEHVSSLGSDAALGIKSVRVWQHQ